MPTNNSKCFGTEILKIRCGHCSADFSQVLPCECICHDKPEQKESEAVCKKCGHKEKYHNDEMGCLVPLNVAFICDCTKFVPEQKESSKTGWRERIVEIYARRQKAHDELLACDIALDKLFKETHEN